MTSDKGGGVEVMASKKEISGEECKGGVGVIWSTGENGKMRTGK